MSTLRKKGVSRRTFLGGASTASAAVLLGGATAPEANGQQPETSAANASAQPPSAAELTRDTGAATPPPTGRVITRPGSDLMVAVMRNLGIEFVAANPASSFEGLHESIINHGDPANKMPELISALHEGSAVDMAHGYGKATGQPMVVMLHATVGLQNASMAIYQAFADKTPMVLLVGSDDGFIQAHVAEDLAALVRPYTKWDALPKTLPEALLAIQQAYREAITPPCAPTLVVLNSLLQKGDAGSLEIPVYQPPQQVTVSSEVATQIAQGLLTAQNPRIEVGRLRSPQGVEAAITLSELTGACVGTRSNQGPMSFPQGHSLCGPGTSDQYDFVLGLELPAPNYSIISPDIGTIPDRDAAGLGLAIVQARGAQPASSAGTQQITADADSSLTLIIEAVIASITAAQRSTIVDRSQRHGVANKSARLEKLRRELERRRRGWDAIPVSTARLYADLWPHIANEDWCMGSQTNFSGGHHADLWQHDKPYSCLGGSGAAGIGYSLGASTGAALAARDRGRIVIDFQNDGDFNFMPGSLWTAAHHKLPMLVIMHNNRAYHQEFMFVQYMTGVRGRGTDRSSIGTTLRDPFIDYKSIANGYGVEAAGPISDPAQLSDAYARGVSAVKEGRPYLIDVVTQPR